MAYNSMGEIIEVFADKSFCPGTYSFIWQGSTLIPGMFYLVLIDNQKMNHLKVIKTE